MTFRTEHLAEGVTLYLGDCREVLPTLAKPDAVISDPPYGIDYNHSGGNRFGKVGVTRAASLRGSPKIEGDAEPFDPQHLIELCDNVLIWGADHFYPRLPDHGRMLGWNKLGDMEPWDSFSDIEFAWHSADKAARVFNMKWKGIACDKAGENGGLREHPTQKPIALMNWCLDQAGAPPRRSDPRSLHGQRHDGRRRSQARLSFHWRREGASLVRHRLPSHLRSPSPARHVHRKAEASAAGEA